LIDFEDAAHFLPPGDLIASLQDRLGFARLIGAPGRVNRRFKLRNSTSRASEDLPDPDTPVTTVNRPSGIRASTLRRLCSVAPLISIAGVAPSMMRRRERECRRAPQDSGPSPMCRAGEFCGGALRHHPPAARARARTQVDHMIGAANGVFIVFDHDQRIALRAQSIQGIQQRDIVARVQSDGRFVQHVAHALQIRPKLRRQANTLGLAPERSGPRDSIANNPDPRRKGSSCGCKLRQQVACNIPLAAGSLSACRVAEKSVPVIVRRRSTGFGTIRAVRRD